MGSTFGGAGDKRMPERLELDLLRATRGDIGERKERAGVLGIEGASMSRRRDRLGGDVEHIKRSLKIRDAEVTA